VVIPSEVAPKSTRLQAAQRGSIYKWDMNNEKASSTKSSIAERSSRTSVRNPIAACRRSQLVCR
jgi:hypothetical protein